MSITMSKPNLGEERSATIYRDFIYGLYHGWKYGYRKFTFEFYED